MAIELMHQDKVVAVIRDDGFCSVLLPRFMPFNLLLEETDNTFIRLKNLERFYYWCATRALTLERSGAKDFLLSCDIQNAKTDKQRAEAALRCHGLSLGDCFWLREAGESISYSQINIFDNPSSGEFVDVVLRDRGMIVRNTGLIPEGSTLSQKNYMPNVWLRCQGHTYLLKEGSPDEVESELLASRIARCFAVDQVLYEPTDFEDRRVTRSELITTKDKSIVFVPEMVPYLIRENKKLWDLVNEQDSYGYHMMNIIDYLVGNTDRHARNWGFWINNENNVPEKLFPLMDFNRCFRSYDSIEGAQCYTYKEEMPQKTAAILGVQAIGLNQIHSLPESLQEAFSDLNSLRQTRLELMFSKRLDILLEAQNI